MIQFIESTAAVFFALILDRTVGVAVQLWGMRRVTKSMTRAMDETFQRMQTEHHRAQQNRRAN